MRFGICTTLEKAAPARDAGWDYIEESVQGLLQGLEPDERWTGRDRAKGSALSFRVGDATLAGSSAEPVPDLVVVNPPRRGIGPDLAAWLERSQVRHVVYSSCNVDSLATDLRRMPSLAVRRARLFDMFPQTSHHEVLLLLERIA